MREVIVAKSAGFCFGVQRAVDMVYEEIEKADSKIYTLGEIIHNEEVVSDLERKGVSVIDSLRDLDGIDSGTVCIRSHGVSKAVYDGLKKRQGLKIVDATCPFVKKIHEIVERESALGKEIIIIGDAAHPEVEGILGYARGPVSVINTEEEAREFERKGRDSESEICLVSQTTFNKCKFYKLVEILQKKVYSITTVNTICSATDQRQKEAREIASKVDAMIVIGGRHSSNTRKLYEICSDECRDTRLIQTRDDLSSGFTDSDVCIGITAGASTPHYIIEEVQSYVRGTEF